MNCVQKALQKVAPKAALPTLVTDEPTNSNLRYSNEFCNKKIGLNDLINCDAAVGASKIRLADPKVVMEQ